MKPEDIGYLEFALGPRASDSLLRSHLSYVKLVLSYSTQDWAKPVVLAVYSFLELFPHPGCIPGHSILILERGFIISAV